MLSLPPTVAYVHEPFNPNRNPRRLGFCPVRFERWYTYVSDENAAPYYAGISRTLELSFDLARALGASRTLRQGLGVVRNYARCWGHRLRGARRLIKDPIAVFSAEWLASTFNMQVVVLIRHPAAFAGSLKKKNWAFPFSHLLQQPLLMRDLLYPFRSEIQGFVTRERDIVDQAALLWRLIYFVVRQYENTHSNWLFVRHEDISRDPIGGFHSLFGKLDLDFTSRIEDRIRKHSESTSPVKQTQRRSPIVRNSRDNIWTWKNRLTRAEVQRVRARVEDVSSSFYSDKDW